MGSNYSKIINDNLNRLYSNIPETLEKDLPGIKTASGYEFQAFGHKCSIEPNRILLDGATQEGPLGIIISLYALYANGEPAILEPLQAFKAFPDSMPYSGAFVTHTQNILVHHVSKIKTHCQAIDRHLNGRKAPVAITGDFSLLLTPLPKISLCYIFYESDEDFPSSVTCLYSRNAISFLPIDALADVGEYTSREIIEIISI